MRSVELEESDDSLEKTNRDCLQVWNELRENNVWCDGTLRTEDGGVFKIHRTIMSTCSPYFKALFTTKIHETPRTDVLIPGVSARMLKQIVDYAYTGRTAVSEQNVTELLPATNQFNVAGMERECQDLLMRLMCAENCIGFKRFAETYFCPELAEAAQKFLSSRFVEVAANSEEFLELSAEEVLSLLDSENLNVSDEELVWKAAVRWIDHDPARRQHCIVDLMRCVRLGLLDTQYFMEKVKTHRYVDNVEICKPIVIETLKFLYDLEMIGMKTAEVETPLLARPRIPYEVLFTIGGWSGGNPTDLVETYDTRADRWIRVNEVDPSGARAYHKCAVLGYDIYVIGGFNGVDYFNSCRCFNAVTKRWREISPMNIKRCYVSVVVLNGFIYALGGYDGHHRQNTAERYDSRSNQWTLITPMNVQRSDASATTLNDCIYIIGGFNGTECLNSCEFYSPTTNQWTSITSMRQRRSGVSCVGHHGKIYALGGFNGISRLVSGERYEPDSDQWNPMPDMFNPRSNFAIEVMDDMIFAIGGFNGASTIFHVECFEASKSEWYEATDMNAARSALAACVVPGLPNVRDYIHQNRDRLMEEKRQKLRQQQSEMNARAAAMAAAEEAEEDEVEEGEVEEEVEDGIEAMDED